MNIGERNNMEEKKQIELSTEAVLVEFRVFEHPLLPPRILKSGFSWPAMFIGPAWLLFRTLWSSACVFGAIFGILHFAINSSDAPILNEMFCLGSDCYNSAKEIADLFILCTANFFVALNANDLWAQDLEKRGYVVAKAVRARSLDDARAILSRQASN